MAERSSIVINGRATLAMAAALFGIGQAAVAWCLVEVVQLRADMAQASGNRWTSKDQAGYMREHQTAHERLPPEWLRREVARQELEDQRLQVQIDRLEAKFLGDTNTNGKYVP